jgi:hypothetical protein
VPDEDENGLSARSGERSEHRVDQGLRPVSDAKLAIFLALLATALVLGYLFLNKLADISSQEDCMLAHRKNCAAVASPSDR